MKSFNTNIETPWDACKVSYPIWSCDEVWEYLGIGGKWAERLPHGWELSGTDPSGASVRAIFDISGLIAVEDGLAVGAILKKIDAIAKRRYTVESRALALVMGDD